MSDAWQSAKIKQFEQVLVGSAGALLRITGTVPRRKSTTEPRPTLLADDGHVVHRFAPIPSPADKRGVLRAAYSVSADVLNSETVFVLELADGYVISLPAPTSGATRLTPEPEDFVDGNRRAGGWEKITAQARMPLLLHHHCELELGGCPAQAVAVKVKAQSGLRVCAARLMRAEGDEAREPE